MDHNGQNVLMIGWEYPPHNSGGLGVACEGLTQALSEQQTQVYFTLPYAHPRQLDHMQLIGCYDPQVLAADITQPPFSAYSSPVSAVPLSSMAAEELATLPQSHMEHRVEAYADLIQSETSQLTEQFDVIHAHDWMSFPAAAQLKHATGKPVVAHIHSTEFDRIPSGTGSSYIHHVEAQGLQVADQIIAVSYYTKHLLIDKYQVPAEKITVVHNGAPDLVTPVRQRRSTFAPGRPVVLFMGRLTMQKGGEYFLQLAKKVAAQLPEVLFVVAGDGDLYHHLLFKAAYDQLSASVLFTGFVRDAQRDALLNRADVFVMPSLSEPFGLVAVEAAQRRTPVIVSKHTGVAEVLPSAIQIDFWDVDAMATQVLQLLQNSRQTRLQVAHQQRDLSALTWQSAAAKVKAVYRRAFLGQ